MKQKDTAKKNKIHSKKTKQKQNVKLMLFAVLMIIVLYFLYIIFLLIKEPTDIFRVEEGKLYLEEARVGYVIRNETVVQGNNYKNGIEQIKSEGEKVFKNEIIFRYYSKNEENLKGQIAELDAKIQETVKSQTDLYYSDIKLIEDQIDEEIEKLNQTTDLSKLTEYEKQITQLIDKKAKIVGEKSPSGSYIDQLNKQRANLEKELNEGAETIKAPKSGIVSYKVDGLEENLKPENFSAINKEYLENLNLKTGKTIATNDECGKIIDNFEAYIATISDSKESKEAKVGDKVRVRLSNSDEIDAEITYISQENEEETLLILKIDKDIEELLNYRKISFDLIWWSHSGLKVPNQSIVEENGLKYVVRNRAGYLSKILVKIKKQNDKYSIITNYTSDELKELGYTSTQITNMRNISIYDEIILKPDLTKVK